MPLLEGAGVMRGERTEADPAAAAPRAVGPGGDQGAPVGLGESGDAGPSFCRFHKCVCVCVCIHNHEINAAHPAHLTSSSRTLSGHHSFVEGAQWDNHLPSSIGTEEPRSLGAARAGVGSPPPGLSFQADPEEGAGGAPVSTSYACVIIHTPTQRHRAQAPSVVSSTRGPNCPRNSVWGFPGGPGLSAALPLQGPGFNPHSGN